MSDTKSVLSRIPIILPICVLIAAIYTGWIFYSRWRETVNIRNAAAAHEIERARKEVEMNGGAQLKITELYAAPGEVSRGQGAQICYGVVNAKNVSFDPPIKDVWPSMSRCIDISPKKTTTYTLVADDGAGHSDKAQVLIKVK